jgi:hypothetical protein
MHYFLPECQPTGRDKNIFSEVSEKAFAVEGTSSLSKQKICASATEKSLKHSEVFHINGQKQTKANQCMVT